VTPKHPPGPPMKLGNMRELGVHHLIASCDRRLDEDLATRSWISHPGSQLLPWRLSSDGFLSRFHCPGLTGHQTV
jgi:hypothetical protein